VTHQASQHNIAGIGNIYKSETLFLRGVWPLRPAGDSKTHVRCRRCGTLVRRSDDGEYDRVTVWCPVCQPERQADLSDARLARLRPVA